MKNKFLELQKKDLEFNILKKDRQFDPNARYKVLYRKYKILSVYNKFVIFADYRDKVCLTFNDFIDGTYKLNILNRKKG